MSHSLNSLKGGYIGDYIGNYYRVIKGDTRSLDSGSSINSSVQIVAFVVLNARILVLAPPWLPIFACLTCT